MKSAAVFAAGVAATELSRADLERAYQPKPMPNSHVIGSGSEIFESMNKHLLMQPHHTQPCEDWDHEELNDMARLLYKYRNKELADIYTEKDDNRKFHFDDITYKEKLWAMENLDVKTNPAVHGKGTHSYDVVRDGKCAEIVMWWIHHLPASTRAQLAGQEGVKVPLLPANGFQETDNQEYIYQVSCSSCHSTGGRLGDNETETKSTPTLRSKVAVGDDPAPGTCPVNPKTGTPDVWYQPMSNVGNRKKRCDWDYDPPCEPCEGIGGYSWGEGEFEITYTSCAIIAKPDDIPADNITTPSWPQAFQVDEVTTLINQISEGGQFPGADPCALHNFNNDTEVLYFQNDWKGQGPIMFTDTSKTDIWTLPTADMFIKISGAFCICVTPFENGDSTAKPTGPLYFDFAKDAVLVGRELIGLEGYDVKVVADHWNKGPHHFWVDVATNLFVRGWQPWNGLNVYKPGSWVIGEPDESIFAVDKSCYSGLLHKNITCIAPYP